MKSFKKDQKVKVISGKYKGQESYILSVLKDNYLIIADVNKKKKANKNNSENFIEKLLPIHSSNVSLLISN